MRRSVVRPGQHRDPSLHRNGHPPPQSNELTCRFRYSELSPFFRAILEQVLTPVFPTCLIIKSNPRQSDRTTKTHFHCRLYAFSGFPEPVDPTVTPSPNPNIESSTTAIRYSNELTKNRNKESGQPEKQASERFSPTSNGLFRLFRPNDSSRRRDDGGCLQNDRIPFFDTHATDTGISICGPTAWSASSAAAIRSATIDAPTMNRNLPQKDRSG